MLPATCGAAAFEWLPSRASWVATSSQAPGRQAGRRAKCWVTPMVAEQVVEGGKPTGASWQKAHGWEKLPQGENKVAPWSLNRKRSFLHRLGPEQEPLQAESGEEGGSLQQCGRPGLRDKKGGDPCLQSAPVHFLFCFR